MSKFIFITGGLVPNIGKGTFASALARLLKNSGVKVGMLKINSYLNIDPGTMSPYQHGEVFVTKDGTETDLDIGNFERFMDEDLDGDTHLTGGMVYSAVINKERQGKYVGATVQVVPHIIEEIKEQIVKHSDDRFDIIIAVLGGTLTDYENGVYLQAIRSVITEIGDENSHLINMEIVPMLESTGQVQVEVLETSVQKLMSFGLKPDTIICRTIQDSSFKEETRKRAARHCYVKENSVFHVPNVTSIYELPVTLKNIGLDKHIYKALNMTAPESDLSTWDFMAKGFSEEYQELKVCIVGKYTKVRDAYLSIEEAIKHASSYNQVKPKIEYIDAEDVEEYGADRFLRGAKAIIVPPGWGSRGVAGMIAAVQFARENKIPYLGIGLGMQMAIIEFARNVVGLENANTTEIDPKTDYPVVDTMGEQKNALLHGKTMRLGVYDCVFDPNSVCAKLYGNEVVSERHRHRYEFNSKYYDKFEEKGMIMAGMNPDSKLVEVMELKNHPFFVCAIFEPEYISRPNKPHPLFMGLMNTAKSIR